MSDHLDKLSVLMVRFADRRRRLLLVRGLAAGVACLLLALILVAAVDRAIIMSVPVRLALSLAGYMIGVAAFLWAGGGRWMRDSIARPNNVELARMLESADPEMRDRVRAAVELREAAADTSSEAFRREVSRDAGERAGRVRIERALPARLAAWRVAAASIIAFAVGLAVVLPQLSHLQVGRLLGRALLPTADIPRASRHSAHFALDDDERLVPRGEPIEFTVNVATRYGDGPKRVELVVSSDDGTTRRIPLTPSTEGEYTGSATFDRSAFVKAWADDADTHQLRIKARPRPAVRNVTVSFRPPSHLEGVALEQPAVTGGDITALAGSTALVSITATLPIDAGELQLLDNTGQDVLRTLPLTANDGEWIAELPVATTGLYRVRITSVDTGFTSRDEPLWTLRAMPDAPPTLSGPPAVNGEPVARDATVSLAGVAKDDVALATIRHEARVGESAWETVGTTAAHGVRRASALMTLDLDRLSLQTGDVVEARLVATDLNGSEVAGPTWRWTAVDHGSDAERMRRLASKEQLHELTLRVLENATAAVEHQSPAEQDDSIAAEQARLLGEQLRSATQDSAARLIQAIGETLPSTPAGREANDLRLLAEAAIQVRADAGTTEGVALAAAAEAFAAELLRAERIALAASNVVTAGAELADADTSLAAALDVAQMSNDEAAADRASEGAAAQFARRQSAVAAQLARAVTQLDRAHTGLAHADPLQRQLDDTRQLLDRSANRHREALRDEGDPRLIRRAGERLARDLTHVRQRALASVVEAEARVQTRRVPLQDESVAARLLRADQAADAAVALGEQAALIARLPDSDISIGQWITDVSLARRAVATEPDEHQREAFAVAIATLEAGQQVSILRRALLAAAARDAATDRAGRLVDLPRDVDSIVRGIDMIRARLLTTGHDPSASGALTAIARSTEMHQALNLLRARRSSGNTSEPLELLPLVAAIAEVEAAIEPAMEEARRVLTDAALSVAETLRAAAREAEHQAERFEQNPAEAERAQQTLEDSVREAVDAVRSDGAAQDFMSEAGRNRARDADAATASIQQAASAARDAALRPTEAAEKHHDLAETLEAVAEHYEALENDPNPQTRQALREMEKELGLREQLDEEYERLERLVELANGDDEEARRALEQELAENPEMRKALEKRSEEATRQAAEALEQAAEREAELAERLREAEERLAEADEQGEAGDEAVMRDIAQQARRIADHNVDPLTREDHAGQAQRAADALREAANQAETPNAAETARQLNTARKALEQEARAATEAAQTAQAEARRLAQKANDAFEAGGDAQTPYRQMLEAKAPQAQAEQRAGMATRAAREAGELAERATEQRDAPQQAQRDAEAVRQETAEAQDELRKAAEAAAEDLERVARNEKQMGNQAKADAAKRAARQAKQAASGEVAQAKQAAESGDTGEAKQAASAAAQALQQSAKAAGQAQAMGRASQPSPGAPSAAAEAMASALDALNGGAPSPSPSPQSAAQQAGQQAAGAQASAMRQNRAPPLPGAPPASSAPAGEGGAEATVAATANNPGALGEAPETGGDWGNLPRDRVQDLLEGRRERAPDEYRDLVEAYYRAVAERARGATP